MGGSSRMRLLALIVGLALVATGAHPLHERRTTTLALHDDADPPLQPGAEEPAVGLPPVVDFVALLALAGAAPLPAPPGATDATRLASASRDPPAAS